ncbi:MAG: DNA mismatch repair protein MutS [Clostridium sp.]|mgnify:CR=1 FL=1|nr:DNA mismatch repair protein MutS [Clostridium sp.]
MNNDSLLEFDRIKEQLVEYCVTEAAREKFRQLEPSLSEQEVRTWLRETTEAKLLIEKGGNPPITKMEDVDNFIQVAKQGGCLTAEQLEKVAAVLSGVRRLKDYLTGLRRYEVSLAYYDENLEALDDVKEEIHEKIRGGRVDDYASKNLKSIRGEIESTEKKMREKADAVLKNNKSCMSDSFSTFRNGHICVPVKKECKFQISGSVIDKSSTGNTLFIEPTVVAKYYEKLQLLRIDEENEELQILYTLTSMLADAEEVMVENRRMVEKLDFVFAKAKLSLDYEGVLPEITTNRRIVLEKGRHPLMNKKVNVPLDFQLGEGVNGIVITGPNTGGKTVAIKTVALNCMMAQCGLHVAAEKAVICMNNAILCDIGDGQDISQNLSTFSSHIVNVLDILKKADKDSLVIMDELGSGTDPTEGMGIAVAILKELKKSGAFYLVTTHYPEVKNYAEKEEGVINARMTFDKESLKPLYQLVIGEAGESCAFFIAEKLGMPANMLNEAAKAAYGEETQYTFQVKQEELLHSKGRRIQKKKTTSKRQTEAMQYRLGDSVIIFPDKQIGIVCKTANDKGVIQVQLRGKRIYINYKRVKLMVAAEELYPEDYDFSVIFDSVELRKTRHRTNRKGYKGLEDKVVTIEE